MSKHIALVTGASRGIGAAVAVELAARGHVVVCTARRAASCEETLSKVKAVGGRALSVDLDLGDVDSIAAAVVEVRGLVAGLGRVDRLVNNAGVAISAPLFARSAEGIDDLWAYHFDVNFHGPRRLVEAFVPDMIESGGGIVVNLASSAALLGYAYVAAYAASKHALLGYTRSAALELAKKRVAFHALCPHYVASPMTDASVRRLVEKTGRTRDQAREFFAAQNPSGRLVSPLQIASCVAELCREGGEAAPGVVLELDGGPEALVV